MAYVTDAQQILTREKKERAREFALFILKEVEYIERQIDKIRKEYDSYSAEYLEKLKLYNGILALSDADLEEATNQYYDESKTLQQILEMLTSPKEED